MLHWALSLVHTRVHSQSLDTPATYMYTCTCTPVGVNSQTRWQLDWAFPGA